RRRSRWLTRLSGRSPVLTTTCGQPRDHGGHHGDRDDTSLSHLAPFSLFGHRCPPLGRQARANVPHQTGMCPTSLRTPRWDSGWKTETPALHPTGGDHSVHTTGSSAYSSRSYAAPVTSSPGRDACNEHDS